MKSLNNFDMSSTGVSISVVAEYDQDRARMDFEDSIQILQYSSYSKNTIAYYKDFGNVKDSNSITFEIEFTPESIAYVLNTEGYSDDAIKAMQEEEIQEIVKNFYGEEITLLNYEYFTETFQELKIKPSKTLNKIMTRGYSQGDYAEVFYCPDDLKDAWGREATEKEVSETIHNLFWKQPIYAKATVNGEDYEIFNMPDFNEYDWKPEAFAEYVQKESGVNISEFVPKDLY